MCHAPCEHTAFYCKPSNLKTYESGVSDNVLSAVSSLDDLEWQHLIDLDVHQILGQHRASAPRNNVYTDNDPKMYGPAKLRKFPKKASVVGRISGSGKGCGRRVKPTLWVLYLVT